MERWSCELEGEGWGESELTIKESLTEAVQRRDGSGNVLARWGGPRGYAWQAASAGEKIQRQFGEARQKKSLTNTRQVRAGRSPQIQHRGSRPQGSEEEKKRTSKKGSN